jgi:(4S)-4-hydroxy-5-phosphonooxypentane-2,3-dione isomerase
MFSPSRPGWSPSLGGLKVTVYDVRRGRLKAEVTGMHIVVVSIHVQGNRIEEFLGATLRNDRATLKEPGVRRFDLMSQADDPARFLLVEVYDHADDHARHKEAEHYKRWAEDVEPLLAEPRARIIYKSNFPHESGWE